MVHCSHTLLFATLGTYSARGVKKIVQSEEKVNIHNAKEAVKRLSVP